MFYLLSAVNVKEVSFPAKPNRSDAWMESKASATLKRFLEAVRTFRRTIGRIESRESDEGGLQLCT